MTKGTKYQAEYRHVTRTSELAGLKHVPEPFKSIRVAGNEASSFVARKIAFLRVRNFLQLGSRIGLCESQKNLGMGTDSCY